MAKIYIRFELIGSGNLDYRNIVSARLVKDRYTPYSELKASVVLNNSINLTLDEQFDKDCKVIKLKYEYPGYTGSRRMHYGPADYIRTRVRGGKTVLELISRGITLMLGQNEPEPGVWSKVSLTDIMKSYSPSSEITYESGTDTVNYVNIKEKSTLWEAIGVYAVKAYGRRAYIRGDRQVSVSLSILSVNIGTQRIIEYGKQLDTRSMLSKIYMKNVDGEYGYSYSSGKTIPHGITREKYYGLDKQWLNNVVVGLKDRIEFAEREYLVEHITYEGYCGEDITDKIICNGYGVNGKRVSRMEITVNSKGMQTKLLCE